MRTILETGRLMQKGSNSHGRKLKYIITFLEEKHLSMIMALQEIVAKELECPDMLHTFSEAFMKQHVEQCGIVLGVFVHKRLVAFRNVYYPAPGDREWNLGYDLGIADKELAQVVNLQMVCVHPRFRGNGLAFKMNQIALKLLRERNTRHHACATVSPQNIWNIPVLLASGFAITKLKNKYGGKERYVVYQNLRNPIAFDDNSTVSVRLDQLDTQKKMLDSGFYGVSVVQRQPMGKKKTAKHLDILFKRPCKETVPDFTEKVDPTSHAGRP